MRLSQSLQCKLLTRAYKSPSRASELLLNLKPSARLFWDTTLISRAELHNNPARDSRTALQTSNKVTKTTYICLQFCHLSSFPVVKFQHH
ncbi:hypothetical protein SRHO_G00286260 [Serrasalmus rhombeus]